MSSSDQKIEGLSLSGGGFRASLFHLGVVRALIEAGLLDHIKTIASVSGGSVLAAHLSLRWKDLLCANLVFRNLRDGVQVSDKQRHEAHARLKDAMEPLLELIDLDVRNRILRRLPFTLFSSWILRILSKCTAFAPLCSSRFLSSSEKRRTVGQLAIWLDVLYEKKLLINLPESPEVIILTTEVASMKHAWFDRNGYHHDNLKQGKGADFLRISEAVSASCAFPALFAPLKLNGEIFALHQKSHSFVTDAGVYDNLGVTAFLRGKFANSSGRVLVSDATATSDWDGGTEPTFLSNLLRSVDIMQQRTAQLQRDSVSLPQRNSKEGKFEPDKKPTTGRFLIVDIATEGITEPPHISQTAQPHMSYIRTDLDRFGPHEKQMLVHHGYSVAWQNLKINGYLKEGTNCYFSDWSSDWPCAMESGLSPDRLVQRLKRGSLAKFKLLALRDPFGLLYLAVVISIILAFPGEIWLKNEGRKGVARERIQAALSIARADIPPQALTASGVAPVPNFNGLRINSFERIFDLRKWKNVPVEKMSENIEAANQQTIYSISRTNSAEKFILPLKTSGIGIGVMMYPLTGKFFMRPTPNSLYLNELLMDMDIKWIPANTEYPIVLNSTYWNGFQKRDKEDAGFTAYTDGDRGNMIVLFPTDRVPHKFQFFTAKGKDVARYSAKKNPFYVFHENGLFFQFTHLEAGSTYGVIFTWSDAEVGRLGDVRPQLVSDLIATRP